MLDYGDAEPTHNSAVLGDRPVVAVSGHDRRGYAGGMPSDATTPSDEQDRSPAEPTPRLRTPADEPAETSVQQQREAVGDAPDTGGLTPADNAQ